MLYTVSDQDIVFIVPDPCWAMVRNSNSINADVTEDAIKSIRTTLVSTLFLPFWQGFFWLFDITGLTQYMYIVRKYQINLHSLRNRTEKFTKGLLFYLILKLEQFFFSDNVHILSISHSTYGNTAEIKTLQTHWITKLLYYYYLKNSASIPFYIYYLHKTICWGKKIPWSF